MEKVRVKGRVGREGWERNSTTPPKEKNLRSQDLYMFKISI